MFKNMPVKWQLGLGFGAVVSFFVLTLLAVQLLLVKLTQQIEITHDHSMPVILAVEALSLSRSDVQQYLTDVAATHDPDGYKDAEEAAQRFHASADTLRQHLHAQGDVQSLRELDSIVPLFDAFYRLGKVMAETYIREGREAGNALMNGSATQTGFDQASDDLLKQLKAFSATQIAAAQATEDAAYRSTHWIRQAMLIGGLLATALAAALSALMVSLLMRQLGGEPLLATELAQRVAHGDLRQAIPLAEGDRSSLMAQLDTMQEHLSGVVRRVLQGAQSVQLASSEIAAGNTDLSHRTEHEAAHLEKSASTIAVLGAAVEQNAQSANRANQLALEASQVAVKGGQVVAEVVNTMQGINEASRKISDIISVIDGIAFQTNILALNAAVEAARAGEQGRGFAVVATEVRMLAGRSAEAAKEIKTLINASVERVGLGTAQVDQAGSTMTEVVSAIQRVTDIVGEISTESHEQASSVRQIHHIVSQIGQSTQQNAALVEEMAAAAGSLQTQAKDLLQTVSVFQLDASSKSTPLALR